MIGEFVVGALLEAIAWVVIEVIWKGFKRLVVGVYRLVRFPFALVGGRLLGAGDDGGDGEGGAQP